MLLLVPAHNASCFGGAAGLFYGMTHLAFTWKIQIVNRVLTIKMSVVINQCLIRTKLNWLSIVESKISKFLEIHNVREHSRRSFKISLGGPKNEVFGGYFEHSLGVEGALKMRSLHSCRTFKNFSGALNK